MKTPLTLLCALALPAALTAQTPRNWVGGTGNWSDPAKWTGAPPGIPAALDPTAISSGTATLDVNATVASFGFTGGSLRGEVIPAGAPRTLTVGGLLTLDAGSGTIGTGQPMTLQANGPISLRIISNLNGVTLNLASGQTCTDYGTHGGNSATNNGTTINNAGTWNATGTSGLTGGTATSFNNSGIFNRSVNTGTWQTTMAFNNSGTVNVDTGTLHLSGGGSAVGGVFTIADAAILRLNGTHSFDAGSSMVGTGTGRVHFITTGSSTLAGYNVPGTTEMQFGTVTFNNRTGAIGSLIVSGGTGHFNGTASPAALTMTSGTANFANDITVAGTSILSGGTVNLPVGKTCALNGASTWNSGTLGGGGTYFLNAGGSTSSGTPKLYGSTLNLPAGQTYVDSYNSGSGTVELRSGAVINNAGTWEYLGDRDINNGLGAMSTFNNSGTFTKRNNTASTVTFQIPFNNSGTVNASAGTLRMTGQSFTQTAGQLVLNGGEVRAAFTLPFLIQGGSITGAGNVLGGVAVTSGTVKPRGILAIQDTDSSLTKGDLTMTSASTLDVQFGGTTAGTQYDRVSEQGNVAFARNGTLAVRFKSSFQYSIAQANTFTILTSNANTTGQFSNVSGGRVTTADFKGTFAINAAGTTSVVLSDFQGYPDIDVEQPLATNLSDGESTVAYGVRTIGTPGIAKTFTVLNTGAANLTGLAVTVDGTNAAEFAVTTALPGAPSATVLPAGTTEFVVTFTPTSSGPRTAALHIASNDPNEAAFDIALTGTGNFAPVLNLPLADVEVEPVDINGAIVTFVVSATDFEDDPDPTAIASPASGSLFPLGDSTVIVTATDTQGITTTGTFVVRVLGGDPAATTLAPSAITINSATLRATIHPNHFATSVQFILDGQPRNPPVNVPAGSTAVTATFNVSGLQPGSMHTANVQAINATGQFIDGGTVNFTMLGAPPAVTTATPTMITPTKARLTATVNPNDLPTTVLFYVGGQIVGTVNVPADSSPQIVTFDYQQLIPGQTVTFNATAINQLAPTAVNGGNNTFNLLASNSTFASPNDFLYAANAGWLNAKPATSYGFRTGDTVCSGFLYATNFGWIHAGTGEPSNDIRYTNTGGDYGINVLPDGTLRGYAWSGNIGWINFEEAGNPRISLTTGQLTGYAWGQNVGWINLNTATTSQLAILDTDHDGISDAWENDRANGNLTTLSHPGDADGDGQPDLAEFAADTDPLDGADRLRIVNFSQTGNGGFVSVEFTSKATRFYEVRDSLNLANGSWQEVGLGTFPGQQDFTTANFNGTASGKKFYRVSAMRPLAGP